MIRIPTRVLTFTRGGDRLPLGDEVAFSELDHLPQFAQAQRGDSKRLHPHGELPRPCAEDARGEARSCQTQLPGTAPHDCDACPDQGEHQGRARHLGTQQGRHHLERLHAGDRGQREADAGGDLCGADDVESRGSVLNAKNLIRFGTVGVCGGPQVIELKGLGA